MIMPAISPPVTEPLLLPEPVLPLPEDTAPFPEDTSPLPEGLLLLKGLLLETPPKLSPPSPRLSVEVVVAAGEPKNSTGQWAFQGAKALKWDRHDRISR